MCFSVPCAEPYSLSVHSNHWRSFGSDEHENNRESEPYYPLEGGDKRATTFLDSSPRTSRLSRGQRHLASPRWRHCDAKCVVYPPAEVRHRRSQRCALWSLATPVRR